MQDLTIPDLRSLLKFPTTINKEALFQLPHVPVGDKILLKHHRKYYSVLQVGMDVVLSLPRSAVYHLENQGSHWICFSKQNNWEFKLKYLKKVFINNNNVICLQAVHGKDEYLQAFQVLAPRFRFLVPFFLKMKTQEDRLSALTGTFSRFRVADIPLRMKLVSRASRPGLTVGVLRILCNVLCTAQRFYTEGYEQMCRVVCPNDPDSVSLTLSCTICFDLFGDKQLCFH